MKTLLHIGTVLLYLWVSIGVSVATHYCAGEPVSATVFDGTLEDISCCCGGQEPMEGCCNTSISTIQLDDDHTVASESLAVSVDSEEFSVLAGGRVSSSPRLLPSGLDSPPRTVPPSYIFHRALLI